MRAAGYCRPLAWSLVLCSAQLWLATARAESSRSLHDTLHVRAGATCLTTDNVALQVQAWLQTDHVRSDVMIEVEGSAVDPRTATFRVVRAGQTLAHRAFAPGPAVCENLRAALGLSIALALKASLLDELGEPLPDDPSVRARGWSLAAAGLVASDVLPGLAPGFDLRAELALPPSVALRLSVLGLAGFDKTFAHASGRFDAGVLALRFDACAGLAIAHGIRGRACAGLLGGPLYAQGKSFVEAKTSVVGWIGFGNSVSVLFDLSPRWSMELGVSVVAPLRRVSVGIHDSAGAVIDARELSAVGLAVGLGPVYRL